MSSNKKNSSASESEYEYVGEEGGQETLLEVPKKPAFSLAMLKEKLIERLPRKKSHKFLLFIGVAIYVLYKFLNVETPPPASSASVPGKIAAQQLAKPPADQSPSKSVEKKAAPTVTAAVPAAITSAKDANTKESIFNKPSNGEASTQVKELQTHLDQISQSLTSLESSLMSLTNSVIRLADKVNALEKTREKSKQVMVIKPAILPVYYLQSLVHGRAWVESPLGDLITVKVGDILPGYGKIQSIDIRTGILATTSGRVISYGPNDS
jgi:hypothetical protein